jgi:hypothetical protein
MIKKTYIDLFLAINSIGGTTVGTWVKFEKVGGLEIPS